MSYLPLSEKWHLFETIRPQLHVKISTCFCVLKVRIGYVLHLVYGCFHRDCLSYTAMAG